VLLPEPLVKLQWARVLRREPEVEVPVVPEPEEPLPRAVRRLQPLAELAEATRGPLREPSRPEPEQVLQPVERRVEAAQASGLALE
jgi:hypothetical protein